MAGVLKDYLEKQQLDGKKKGWTKRWFVLEGNQLSYFENEKSKTSKSTFKLGKGTITCDVERLQFEVRTESYARGFKAPNPQAFRNWVMALYRIMVSGVFGKPISHLQEAPFLTDWYNYLIAHGLEVEGVFRVPGQHEAIKELKARYNRGEQIHLAAQDEVGTNFDGVHIVADLLKTWVRTLPLKLISAEVVEEIAAAGDAVATLKEIFTKMLTSPHTTPPIFAAVLRQLLDFLALVHGKSDINKMTNTNLAVCFTPSLCYLPMSQMESANGILKKLALCLGYAIADPEGWLPVTDEMRAVGAGAESTTPAGGGAAAEAMSGGGGAGAEAYTTTTKGKETEHVREDSDLTKLVKSAKEVKLNAKPLGPIEDMGDGEGDRQHSRNQEEDQRASASGNGNGHRSGNGNGGSRRGSRRTSGSPETSSTQSTQALADAKAMRQKLRDAGWVSKKARDGRTFFFHRKERRSSWSADGLVACWIRVKSSTTGKPYFYHSITKESKWRLGKGDLTFEHIFAPDDDEGR